MRIETLAVHAGLRVDPTTGAVAPPLHTATTFEHEPDSSAPRGFLYSRNANPNRNALEECLAELEGGAAAATFASASAATAAVFQALGPGDHVVRWPKPARPAWMDEGTYRALPESLEVREIRVVVKQPGFRVRQFGRASCRERVFGYV